MAHQGARGSIKRTPCEHSDDMYTCDTCAAELRQQVVANVHRGGTIAEATNTEGSA